MNRPERGVFTLSDIRAIRYLVLVLGGVGLAMFLITDRETPLLVVAFITTLVVVPIAAIYFLRRMSGRGAPDQPESKAPEAEGSGSGNGTAA